MQPKFVRGTNRAIYKLKGTGFSPYSNTCCKFGL
jgi:hypothetical protein